MKAKALTQAWFSTCPRYLTAERFCRAVGLADGKALVESLLEQGAMPSRRVGRHVLIDMHELKSMLLSEPGPESDDV